MSGFIASAHAGKSPRSCACSSSFNIFYILSHLRCDFLRCCLGGGTGNVKVQLPLPRKSAGEIAELATAEASARL